MQLGDLDFTDDLDLLSHTHKQFQIKTNSVVSASISAGLDIHKGKSEILKCNTKNTNPITLDGEILDEMETFITHLGSIIDEQGESDANVKVRIEKARTLSLQLKNICNSKQLSTNIKVRIFNMNVETVLL
ncbi:unnamed protein product [Schistosoma margrebowiei]|uniref:Uncharacterized protein n=1 Tax=Schistosoma margrebowiei TaxID=48269 RepID=A0A183LLN3_9TREM|nr:unnamed protein product [Schistosoma margrebowiei]